MKNKNLINPPITDEQFFDTSNIKNKKLIQLASIMKDVEDKINNLGLPVSFIKK
jgi:hypothetical protein